MDRLDTLLGGGLPTASTTIIMGPSGTGKTTLGLQFLGRCSQAEPGLMLGFYETPARINAKINGVCPPLRALVESDAVQVHWQPPTADLLDAYAERLLETVRRRKVERLFIDGLGAMQEATSSEPDRMGKFLTALMNELRVLGVTTLYSLEVAGAMGPTIQAPVADLASLGENLILLRFVELRSRLHRLISVLKVRDSAFDSSLYEYVTSSQGLLIAENSDSAEDIMAGSARQPQGELIADGQRRERHGR